MPREQTANQIERHIQLLRDSSIYLMVVSANIKPITSLASQLIQSHKLEPCTIEVLSMFDEAPKRMFDTITAQLLNLVDKRDVVLEPLGWFATINAPLGVKNGSNLT